MKQMRDLLMVVLGTMLFSPNARTQSDGAVPPDSAWQQRLEELDQKVRILERNRELEKEAEAAKKKETPVVSVGPDGFSLKSADGAYLLKLRSLVQADSRFFLDEENDPLINGFFIRRMRFLLEGTVAKMFDYRFMPDFAGGVLVLQDAYTDIRFMPELKARFGKYKVPFGIERLQSPQYMMFIERALPNNLVPNRDIGLQLHGDLFAGGLIYAAGVFNGVRDGGSSDLDVHDNKDYAARLFAQPFIKSELPVLEGLGIGIAATAGHEHGTITAPALPAYLSPGQFVVFRYLNDGKETGTVYAKGSIVRFSPQTYYSYGAFSLVAEYVQSAQWVQKETDRQELTNKAYQAAGAFVLTGENASYRGVVPKQPFDLDGGTWGAFEVALRFHVLDVDDDAFPTFASAKSSVTKQTAASVGFNWYLNKNVRISANYDQTRFKGGAAAGDRSVERTIMTRLSLGF